MEYKEQDGTTQLMIIPTTSVYAVCVSHAVAYFTGYEACALSLLCFAVMLMTLWQIRLQAHYFRRMMTEDFDVVE